MADGIRTSGPFVLGFGPDNIPQLDDKLEEVIIVLVNDTTSVASVRQFQASRRLTCSFGDDVSSSRTSRTSASFNYGDVLCRFRFQLHVIRRHRFAAPRRIDQVGHSLPRGRRILLGYWRRTRRLPLPDGRRQRSVRRTRHLSDPFIG